MDRSLLDYYEALREQATIVNHARVLDARPELKPVLDDINKESKQLRDIIEEDTETELIVEAILEDQRAKPVLRQDRTPWPESGNPKTKRVCATCEKKDIRLYYSNPPTAECTKCGLKNVDARTYYCSRDCQMWGWLHGGHASVCGKGQ